METKISDGLTRARIISYISDITCGIGCWSAKDEICRCSCGGRNHGTQLRGESAQRTAKINGYRYELLGVGKYRDLLTEVEQLVLDAKVASGEMKLENGKYYAPRYIEQGGWFETRYVHPTEYNRGGGLYVLKYASLSQCIHWNELAYFDVSTDQKRYHAGPAILWTRSDLKG